MTSYKNYRLIDFADVSADEAETYSYIIRKLEPTNELNGKEFAGIWKSSYEVYLQIKDAFIKRPKDWQFIAIKAAFKLTHEQQLLCRVFEYYAALRFLEDDLMKILAKEKLLNRPPKPELKAAGIDKLNKYGDVLTLDSLARTYGTSWEDIAKWKYSKIYTILALERDRADIDEKYQQILRRKNERLGK